MNNILIRELKNSDLNDISDIVTRNMLEINSKDYGLEEMKEHAKSFSRDNIEKSFSKREKVFVAVINNEIVGTASLEADWNKIKDTYWVLTVFIKPEYHHMGIGKLLMNKLEEYARSIKAKKLIIPASITGCEFYHKLGYNYKDNKKELNENKMYILEKELNY